MRLSFGEHMLFEELLVYMGSTAQDRIQRNFETQQVESARTFIRGFCYGKFKPVSPERFLAWCVELFKWESRRPSKECHQLYPKPNGGKRILPSVYAQLKMQWLRSSGQMMLVHKMNPRHVHFSMELLKESHGNLIAKCTSLLGKMHGHFRNQPDIQDDLERLCLKMQAVEVHEVYPIFGTLAQYDSQEYMHVSADDIDLEWDSMLGYSS